jgi:DedD protein
MPIFSTRSRKPNEDDAPTRHVPIDSIETLRTRARQRLIGAVMLVALGIITFTLLFDSQPRPIPVDIQITMPDKDKPDATTTTTIAASSAPAAPTTAAVAVKSTVSEPSVVAVLPDSSAITSVAPVAAAVATTAATAAVQASASLSAKEEIIVSKTDKKPEVKIETKPAEKPAAKAAEKPAAKPDTKFEPKVEAKPVVKTEPKPVIKPAPSDDAAKALAILEGKEPQKAAATAATTPANAMADTAERFIVQFGAYAENEKAREARLKVERAGLKTYVHVAETPEGRRIRVRAGPFATRAEAEKAATRIKALSLPAAILTL